MIKIFCTISLFVIACSTQAQNLVPGSLQKQFSDYSTAHLQEKIFVHTDREFYTAGDNIWFKIYIADGILQQPIDLSKIVYAELISAENKPFLQAKIIVAEGMGSGTFSLPYSIPTGNYILRCYTSLMKNYSADYYFEKQITIANTLKGSAANNPDPAENYDVQFFPEGGNLVSGFTNNIGFKITDKSGKGIEATGAIINQQNDTVARFKTLMIGMGHFNFTPKAGEQYRATVTCNNGKSFYAAIPAIASNAYAMLLQPLANGQLKLLVNSNQPNPETVYLFIKTRQSFKKIITASTNNGTAEFVINNTDVGEGVSTLTVFNADKVPLCERLYFKRPEKQLAIKTTSNHLAYERRKLVNVDIYSSNTNGLPLAANLSMAVVLKDSLNNSDQTHILSYMWLCSDLRGKIEQADFYFSDTSEIVKEAADNLMLTQGWRRFDWKEVTGETKPLQYLPETNGHIVTGVISSKTDLRLLPNTSAFISFPGQSFKTANALSNTTGKLYFDASPSFGSNEVIVQPVVADSTIAIDIENPFSNTYSTRQIGVMQLLPAWRTQLTNRSIAMQVQQVFSAGTQAEYHLNTIYDTAAFYGKSAVSYLLDDYTRFTTMEEVLREYVKEVKLRKAKNNFFLDVKSGNSESGFVADPLVMLDGVPLHDLNKLMAFDPLKIKRIDVIAEKYYSGAQINDGIISFSTYQGDLAGFNVDANATIVEYEGLQLEKQFYSPRYATADQIESRMPDYRQLLHWVPFLNTATNGKAATSFYTSDISGNYSIIVEGITNSGLAGFTISSFIVH